MQHNLRLNWFKKARFLQKFL